jgi:hypothetical protein
LLYAKLTQDLTRIQIKFSSCKSITELEEAKSASYEQLTKIKQELKTYERLLGDIGPTLETSLLHIEKEVEDNYRNRHQHFIVYSNSVAKEISQIQQEARQGFWQSPDTAEQYERTLLDRVERIEADFGLQGNQDDLEGFNEVIRATKEITAEQKSQAINAQALYRQCKQVLSDSESELSGVLLYPETVAFSSIEPSTATRDQLRAEILELTALQEAQREAIANYTPPSLDASTLEEVAKLHPEGGKRLELEASLSKLSSHHQEVIERVERGDLEISHLIEAFQSELVSMDNKDRVVASFRNLQRELSFSSCQSEAEVQGHYQELAHRWSELNAMLVGSESLSLRHEDFLSLQRQTEQLQRVIEEGKSRRLQTFTDFENSFREGLKEIDSSLNALKNNYASFRDKTGLQIELKKIIR